MYLLADVVHLVYLMLSDGSYLSDKLSKSSDISVSTESESTVSQKMWFITANLGSYFLILDHFFDIISHLKSIFFGFISFLCLMITGV